MYRAVVPKGHDAVPVIPSVLTQLRPRWEARFSLQEEEWRRTRFALALRVVGVPRMADATADERGTDISVKEGAIMSVAPEPKVHKFFRHGEFGQVSRQKV